MAVDIEEKLRRAMHADFRIIGTMSGRIYGFPEEEERPVLRLILMEFADEPKPSYDGCFPLPSENSHAR